MEQSKGWSSIDSSRKSAEDVMFSITEEELYNIPTAEYAHRTRFLQRNLTVYHVAFSALADLKDVKVRWSVHLYSKLSCSGSSKNQFRSWILHLTRNSAWQATEALLEMLKKDGKDTDTYCVLQIMRYKRSSSWLLRCTVILGVTILDINFMC